MKWRCNFSLRHYFEVLDYAKNNYKIGPVGDFIKLRKYPRFILLRHDVDLSLDYALRLAKLEVRHGLRSTYFILLRSRNYNVWSDYGTSIIRNILLLGHEIGLHIDTRFFRKSETDIRLGVIEEAQILQSITGKKIKSISQHFPTITPEMTENALKGYIYCHGQEIMRDSTYISDSGMNWRSTCMCNHIDNKDRLQILTHPIWWVIANKSRSRVIQKLRQDEILRTQDNVKSYRKIVQTYINDLNRGK